MPRIGILEIARSGGVTLLLLAALSIYSLALLWERWNCYKRALRGSEHFLERLRQYLAKGELSEAMALSKQHHGPAAEVALASLAGSPDKAERMRSAERTIERQQAKLQRGLGALGTIGSTAPFIGLFGTVLGVMRAFHDLAGASGAGPGVVAVGISEALVATAAGLFVAIPAIVGYNYFTVRASQYADELRWIAEDILERLTERHLR